MSSTDDLREEVRRRYAAAALAVTETPTGCGCGSGSGAFMPALHCSG